MRLFSPEPLRDNHHDRFLHLIQVSAALSRFRVQSGLSVTEAANRAGITESRLNELETGSGRYLASEEEIAALARTYRMSSNDVTRFYNSIRYLSYGHNNPPVVLLVLAAWFSLLALAPYIATLLSRLIDFELPQTWSFKEELLALTTDTLWFVVIFLSVLVSVFSVLALVYTPTTKPRVWLYRARLLVPSSGLPSEPSGKTDLSLGELPAVANFGDLAVVFHGMRQELRQADSRARRRDLIMLLSGTVLGFLVNVVTGPLVKFFS